MRRFVLLVAFGLLLTRSAMADGSIVSWGDDFYDLVSDTPTGTGFQAIGAGYSNSIALKGPTGPNPCDLRCSTGPNHRRNGFAAMPVESNETNKE